MIRSDSFITDGTAVSTSLIVSFVFVVMPRALLLIRLTNMFEQFSPNAMNI